MARAARVVRVILKLLVNSSKEYCGKIFSKYPSLQLRLHLSYIETAARTGLSSSSSEFERPSSPVNSTISFKINICAAFLKFSGKLFSLAREPRIEWNLCHREHFLHHWSFPTEISGFF